MKDKQRGRAALSLAAVLAGAVIAGGCSTGTADPRGATAQQEGKTMNQGWAGTALATAETGGKLDGLEIEHYVSGGLPPPHYRSEQLRLLVRDGRDIFELATPNYAATPKQGEGFPSDVYRLPATPAEVKTIARLVRESNAFGSVAPPAEEQAADRMRTELLVTLHGKEAKRVYAGAAPPELAKLREVLTPLMARLRAQGEHRVSP